MKLYRQIKILFISQLRVLTQSEKRVFIFSLGIKVGVLGFYLGEMIL